MTCATPILVLSTGSSTHIISPYSGDDLQRWIQLVAPYLSFGDLKRQFKSFAVDMLTAGEEMALKVRAEQSEGCFEAVHAQHLLIGQESVHIGPKIIQLKRLVPGIWLGFPAIACYSAVNPIHMSRHMLSYMPKIIHVLLHLAVLCDSLRCGAYGTFCYGIS